MSQDDALTDGEFLNFLFLIATIMLGEHAAMADDVVYDSITAMQMAPRQLIDPQKMRAHLVQAVTNKSRSVVRHFRVLSRSRPCDPSIDVPRISDS